MKPETPPAIVDPCPLSWNGMRGDDKRRFCEHCQLHVHNLSQLSARERRDVLASPGHVCITYAVDAAGALLTRDRPRGLLALFSRLRIAALALVATILPLGASCASRQVMGKPMPPKDTACPTPTPSPSPAPELVVPGGISLPPPTPPPLPHP